MTYILAVDVDDTVMNYTEGLRKYVAKTRGVDPATLPDPDSWNFTNWGFSSRDDFVANHTAAVDEGLFVNSSAFEGASESLWRLSDAGFHIRIVTSCFVGNGRHALAGSDRFLWLDKENIPFRDICFISKKTDVLADMYIDDSPSHIEALLEIGRKVLIMDRPYNRYLIDSPRAYNWKEAESYLLDHFSLLAK